jgi:beta-N-acetylhexosaminidase
VDFAPVADLHDGHEGTGLGNRAASAHPMEVAQAVGAFLSGLESEGVRGCLKHFPGLGGTLVDSHKALPVIDDPARVQRNLHPFQMLAHEDRLVMVAHLKTPFTQGEPSSLHRGSVAGNPWGIRARFIPDDMEMGGCFAASWDERVRKCLEAGHQALLVCQTPEGIQGCAEAARRLPDTLWRKPLEEFRSLRRRLMLPLEGPFQREAWQRWVIELMEEASRA